MARLRFDAISAGSLDQGPLDSGAVIITSSALADIGDVNNGNTADIAIHRQDSVTGRITQYEVLQITGHFAGEDSAVVARGIRGTDGMPPGQGFTWASGSTWTHGANQDDFNAAAIGADPAGAASAVQLNLNAEVDRAKAAEATISATAAAAQATANDALPKFGGIMTGMVSAPVIASTGTEVGGTGARFVGGVTGAAPTTGTWMLGDFVVDQTGFLWICTMAGSPGIWKKVG